MPEDISDVVLFPGSLEELKSIPSTGRNHEIASTGFVRSANAFPIINPKFLEEAENRFRSELESLGYDGVIRYELLPAHLGGHTGHDLFYWAQGLPIKVSR
ncbi:MAG: hypothetical protein AABX04_03345 [Nanoarchaeota archaeon]